MPSIILISNLIGKVEQTTITGNQSSIFGIIGIVG